MATNTAQSRKSHRIAASWAGVAAALLATGALATTVLAGGNDSGEGSPAATTPTGATSDAYVACMRSAGGSPDTLEHWVDACQAAARAAEDRYLTCMRAVGGSPDALEHWVASCRRQAIADQRP